MAIRSLPDLRTPGPAGRPEPGAEPTGRTKADLTPQEGNGVPFFIVGAPRSGTTLAARLVDSHSRLAVYLELNYYPIFRPIAHLYGDLSRQGNRRRFLSDVIENVRVQRGEPPRIDELEQFLVVPTFEGILTAFLDLHAHKQGKTRGGEKTPLHYRYLADILAGFPESPVLFIIRDPRDVVLSMSKAWNASVQEGARVWNDAFLRYFETASSAVSLVRYEDLVNDPTGACAAMCRALGQSFEPQMLDPPDVVPKRLKDVRHVDLEKLSGPVVRSSVGNHREMGPERIREIESACAMGMEAMGYEFSARPRSTAAPVVEDPGFFRFSWQRLRYYGRNSVRWRHGIFRWRTTVRVWLHYLIRLRLLRHERPVRQKAAP